MKRRMILTIALVGLLVPAGALLAQSPQEWVQAHNVLRTDADCGSAPMKWSQQMADLAQEWANKIANGQASGHRNQSDFAGICDWNYCGENIWEGSGTGDPGVGAVRAWHDSEIQAYDRNARKCTSMCGHYTQVVSFESTEVGCANGNAGDKWVTVCNYNPGGNYPDGSGVYRDPICPNHPGAGGAAAGGAQQGGIEAGDWVIFKPAGNQCVKITKVAGRQYTFEFPGGGSGDGPKDWFLTVDDAKAQGAFSGDCPPTG